jgi:hypothetical protein
LAGLGLSSIFPRLFFSFFFSPLASYPESAPVMVLQSWVSPVAMRTEAHTSQRRKHNHMPFFPTIPIFSPAVSHASVVDDGQLLCEETTVQFLDEPPMARVGLGMLGVAVQVGAMLVGWVVA